MVLLFQESNVHKYKVKASDFEGGVEFDGLSGKADFSHKVSAFQIPYILTLFTDCIIL